MGETDDRRELDRKIEHLCLHLDSGIASAVCVLLRAGIETFESCEGGPGHSYPEPTVRFHGQRDQGFKAFAAATENGLRVSELRRVWDIVDGEPSGPHWEMTFVPVTTRDEQVMEPADA